jgi:hypothetical protein
MVLDVEGAETLILRTVPWQRVDIEVRQPHGPGCVGSQTLILRRTVPWHSVDIEVSQPDGPGCGGCRPIPSSSERYPGTM